jgi:hypothetical protein
MEAIPEDFLRTVVFLCTDKVTPSGSHIPKATGFFVRTKDSPIWLNYVVTARHCIEKARSTSSKLYVRMNCCDGKFEEFPTEVDDWFIHDRADVAAIPFVPESKRKLDFAVYRIEDSIGGAPDYKATVERFGQQQEIRPRIGHQVYFLGLFTEEYGERRNLPVARFGHISRMPTPIRTKICETWYTLTAYLMEFHSLGGYSGSPVFVMYPTVVQDSRTYQVDLTWANGLMGILSGHYEIKEDGDKEAEYYEDIETTMNSGMALVTPSVAIKELLMRSDLVENRKELMRIVDSQGKPNS